MKKILPFLMAGLMLNPLSVLALVSGNAYTDSVGNVNYTFSDGTSGSSYKDSAGLIHYQFSSGLYGKAYTDVTGNTHYYFDDLQKNKYVGSICKFPTGFTCTDESQYQEMYSSAAQGLPPCNNQRTGEFGSFTVPEEYCTVEGKEQLIMSGTYGPSLKLCRQHIELYKTSKAVYESCEQKENEKWQKYAQMEFDILKQQTDNERKRLEIEKIKLETNKATTPVKSSIDSNDNQGCSTGLVWNGSACVTCAVYMPHSSAKNYSGVTACTCDNGFHYDLSSQSCLTATEWLKRDQKPNTLIQSLAVEQERKKILEEQRLENEKKAVDIMTTKVNPIKTIIPVKNKEIKNTIIQKNDTDTKDSLSPVSKEETVETVNKISEPLKKVGVFQKVGEKADGAAQGVSNFFRKIFTQIKFW